MDAVQEWKTAVTSAMPTLTIRDAADLRVALLDFVRDMGVLPGPNGMHWLPCSHCNNIVAAPPRVVAILCDDCLAPCDDPNCGLLKHEHRDGCEVQP